MRDRTCGWSPILSSDEKWLEGRVLESRHWTEALFSLRVADAPLQFEAGQFVRIALDIEGERIARPFSFVNPPREPVHEFYGIVVPEGPLSPRLAALVHMGQLARGHQWSSGSSVRMTFTV